MDSEDKPTSSKPRTKDSEIMESDAVAAADELEMKPRVAENMEEDQQLAQQKLEESAMAMDAAHQQPDQKDKQESDANDDKDVEEENQIVVNLKFIHLDQISVCCNPSIGIAELKRKVLAKHLARLPQPNHNDNDNDNDNNDEDQSQQAMNDNNNNNNNNNNTSLRLIYKGKVLKDDQQLLAYNFNSHDTMHAVFGPPQTQTSSQNQTSSASSASPRSGIPIPTAIAGVSNASMRDFGNGVVMGQISIDADSDSPLPDIGGIINSMLSNLGGSTSGDTVIISSSNMDLARLTPTPASSSSTSTTSAASPTSAVAAASATTSSTSTPTVMSSSESLTSSSSSSSTTTTNTTTTTPTSSSPPLATAAASSAFVDHGLLNRVAQLRRVLPPIELAPHSQPSGLSDEMYSLSMTMREAGDTFLAVHRQLQFLSTRFLVENELTEDERTRIHLRVRQLVPFLNEMADISTSLSRLLGSSTYGSPHDRSTQPTAPASASFASSSTTTSSSATRPTISMRSYQFGHPVSVEIRHHETIPQPSVTTRPAPTATTSNNAASTNTQHSNSTSGCTASSNASTTGSSSSSSPFDVFQFVNMVAQSALNATGSGPNMTASASFGGPPVNVNAAPANSNTFGANAANSNASSAGAGPTGTASGSDNGFASFLNLVSAISAAANGSRPQQPTSDTSAPQAQTQTQTQTQSSPPAPTEVARPATVSENVHSSSHNDPVGDRANNVCENPLSRLLMEIVKGWPEDFEWDENSNGADALSIVRQRLESILPSNHFKDVDPWCENAVLEVELAMQLVLEENHRWCVDDEVRRPLFELLMRKFVELGRRRLDNGLTSLDFEMQLRTLLKKFWGLLYMEMVDASNPKDAVSLTVKLLEELMGSVAEQDEHSKVPVHKMTKWMKQMMNDHLHSRFAAAA